MRIHFALYKKQYYLQINYLDNYIKNEIIKIEEFDYSYNFCFFCY